MRTKPTKQISLGRTTAAITFTRNNNRVSRHATTGKQARVGNHRVGGPLLRSLIVTCLVSLVPLGIAATSAQAETTGPVWKILSVATPTNFTPEDQTGNDAIVVTAVNVGGASTGCTAEQVAAEPRPVWSPLTQCPAGSPVVSPVTISDVVPSGMTAVEVYGDNAYQDPLGENTTPEGRLEQDGPRFGLACTLSPRTPSCTTGEPVAPGDTLVVTIVVHVETGVPGSGEVNQASVSGGGAVAASVSDPITVSSTPAAYGIANGGVLTALSSTQAGAHPNFTTEFFLNTVRTSIVETVEPSKDVNFDLPAGLVGSAVGMARCSMAAVVDRDDCPRNTMVGVATLIVSEEEKPRLTVTTPVFNITPAPGEPAAFAIDGLLFPVRLDTSVTSDGEYRVRVSTPDLTGGGSAYMASITIWGVPSEHSGAGPDALATTLEGNLFLTNATEPPQLDFGGPGTEAYKSGDTPVETVDEQPRAFLTNPTQCSTSLTSELETDSWVAPGMMVSEGISSGTPSGCGVLLFEPSFSMLPDTLQAGAPAGYTLNLSVPQPSSSETERLGTPDVKDVTTTLPAGVVLSPSAANGLGSCTNEQFARQSGAPAGCPANSKVGTVQVKSPATEETLGGDVYLGAPECDPCSPADAAEGRMVRLFIQIESQPEAAFEGPNPVLVKLEGRGMINQRTGQLTTTFTGLPQLPFSDFKLILNSGERAALSNPRACGTATTAMDLTPWSTPYTPDATPASTFEIDENCFGPQFSPSFAAGTTSDEAGAFSPFTLSFGRSDADQELSGLQVTLPPGLLGMISKVSLCQEPQAAQGTCAAASEIGEASADIGPGGDPYLVGGGKVYLTGPYKGAPYGLSVVVPAKAGPFVLSGTSGLGTDVVRAAITVNSQSGAVTVTSDPLPTETDGIPNQIRQVNTTIGTNGAFSFNPTSCEKLPVNATLTSVSNLTAARSSSFQAVNCATLKFAPKLVSATAGKASKPDGASLDVKVVYPTGPEGTYANIKSVKVDLPKQLPSRLTTLQKACLAKVFEANPANCPPASDVGMAIAKTPVLNVALEGPAYLVSHGNEAFPDLEIVLQGEGVTLILDGNTDIKKGITSSTFKSVPDAPVSSFQLILPMGKDSILGSNVPEQDHYNLCGQTLAMPTEITAQNGMVLKPATKISVTGCPRAKKAVKKKKTKKAKKSSSARKSSYGQGGRS
jgi:hypothetical protein